MSSLLRYEPLAGSFDGLINQLFRPVAARWSFPPK
jgi:hypothetical protein